MKAPWCGVVLLLAAACSCSTASVTEQGRLSPVLVELRAQAHAAQPAAAAAKAAARMEAALQPQASSKGSSSGSAASASGLERMQASAVRREVAQAGGLHKLEKRERSRAQAASKRSEALLNAQLESAKRAQEQEAAEESSSGSGGSGRGEDQQEPPPDMGNTRRCDESGCDTEVDLDTKVNIVQHTRLHKSSESSDSASVSLQSLPNEAPSQASEVVETPAAKAAAKAVGVKGVGPLSSGAVAAMSGEKMLMPSQEVQPKSGEAPPKLPAAVVHAEAEGKRVIAAEVKQAKKEQQQKAGGASAQKSVSKTNSQLGLTASGMIKSVPTDVPKSGAAAASMSLSSSVVANGAEQMQSPSEVPKKGAPPPPTGKAGGASSEGKKKKGKKTQKKKQQKKGSLKWNPAANPFLKGGLGVATKSRSSKGTVTPSYSKPHS